MNTVKIAHVIVGWDMRQKHKLRQSRKSNSLKRGECLVAFNRTRKMARIIDCVGAVHDYYCEEGQFDIDQLKKMVKAGMLLDLSVGRNEQRRITRLELAA